MSTVVPQAGRLPASPPIHGVSRRVCLALCTLFEQTPLRKLSVRANAPAHRFDSNDHYIAERVSSIDHYEQLFDGFTSFDGKTVLELGCSSGYLLQSFLERHRFRAVGADIDPKVIARGREQYGHRIEFVETTATSIPLPAGSADVVYTVDTVEHLSRPPAIFMEVHRVLKPGGVFLIYFAPWYGPHGAHLEDIIPFPWPHVLFSMDTLLDVAAHLYESPRYVPACYWYDLETGERRPNPYLDHAWWKVFLNDLTIRKFDRLIRTLPFEIVHNRRLGFGGRSYRFARMLGWTAQVPVLNEFFIKAIFCVLRKPDASTARIPATARPASSEGPAPRGGSSESS
jgi:SAM-dependent methyltransferase